MQKSTLLSCLPLIVFLSMKTNAASPPDPLISSIQCQGVLGLDFSSSGNNQQIGLFIINCNDTPGGFAVTFQFTNACQFKSGAGAIPWTDLVLNKVGGTLGSGLTDPVNLDIFHSRTVGGTEYLWDPGPGQKSETVNYIVELKATWDNPARYLAGFYFETIEATITAR
jgi:hypothetical protein